MNTEGIRVPPDSPCTIRQAIRLAKSPLAAQPAELRVKIESAPTNSQRMLKIRVSTPVSGIAITSAIR